MNNSIEFTNAKEKAIRFLALSKKTNFEVRSKLKKLSIPDDVIDDVCQYLQELGYIDDSDYVESFIRQCEKMQKLSIYEIKQKLLIKGITRELILEKVDKLYNTDYETNIVKRLVNGKLSTMEEEKRRNYLYRRGFKTNE